MEPNAWPLTAAARCSSSPPKVPGHMGIPGYCRKSGVFPNYGVVGVMAIFRQQPFMLFTPSADYNVSRQVRDNLNLAHGGVMKRLYRIVTITAPLIVLVLQSAGAADTPSKQIAARTELYQIQTLTLSDQQFLKGQH